MNNLLATITYIDGFTAPKISGLTGFIGSIIEMVSSIGLGIIIFTILLKLVMLPLDYFSRASMRKNSLKMEKMRPELEKLQKQYANDKQMYNQKMMALYKKEGYSMFGSCLPTIITLVLFFIVLDAFNKYASFKNVDTMYKMTVSYNEVIDRGIDEIDGFILKDENGIVAFKDSEIRQAITGNEGQITVEDKTLTVKYYVETQNEGTIDEISHNKVSYTTGGYTTYVKYIAETDGQKNYIFDKIVISPEILITNDTLKYQEQTFAEYKTAQLQIDGTKTDIELAETFINEIQGTASAETFEREKDGFLWVKNIWVPDTAMKHPVYSTYDEFNKQYSVEKRGYNLDEREYSALTAKMSKQKTEANGYFILVVLTIGSSLLMQFVTTKSQKAQMELQSVDGNGAKSQKMMMWMMPIMMGVFAFIYTAAFSLYIIMSSLTSLLSTIGINKIVDIRYKKEVAKKEQSKDKRFRKKVKEK